MIRTVGKGLLGATVAGAAGAYAWARTTMGADAVDRIYTYDKVAVPMILDYKWLEWKLEIAPHSEFINLLTPLSGFFPVLPEEEQKRQFQILHEKHAKPLFDCFMELGGFYYKSGQKIAANYVSLRGLHATRPS